jgi:hypothetical protein
VYREDPFRFNPQIINGAVCAAWQPRLLPLIEIRYQALLPIQHEYQTS